MSDILAYRILRAEIHTLDDRKGAMDSAAAKLERLVASLLAQGWEPLGGVAAEHLPAAHVWGYSQAMILREPGGI